MGADVVLDYGATDLFSGEEAFDVIFDLAGRLQFSAIRHLLTPHGIFVDPAPTPAVMAGSVIENLFHAQKHGILMSKMNAADVTRVLEAVETGPITVFVGGEFPLDRAAAAHVRGEKGGGLGKIVLTV
jgi:NADPH:quinone reductase-like Zn-dependent oxidoreductase